MILQLAPPALAPSLAVVMMIALAFIVNFQVLAPIHKAAFRPWRPFSLRHLGGNV